MNPSPSLLVARIPLNLKLISRTVHLEDVRSVFLKDQVYVEGGSNLSVGKEMVLLTPNHSHLRLLKSSREMIVFLSKLSNLVNLAIADANWKQ